MRRRRSWFFSSSSWQLVAMGMSIAACGCRPARTSSEARAEAPAHSPIARAAQAPPREQSQPQVANPLEKEIEWARAHWPDELAGVEFESRAARLTRWVSPGRELEAYVLAPDWDCKAVLLRLPAQDDEGSEVPPQAWLPDFLVGWVIVSEEILAGGDRERRMVGVTLGHVFNSLGGQLQRWNASGELVSDDGFATGDGGTVHGVLSHVGDEVARFEGQATKVSVSCNGPWDTLTCPNGEKQSCDRCERVHFAVADYHPGDGSNRLGPPQACPEQCPQRTHGAMHRLQKLLSTARTWRHLTPQELAERKAPTLHRSRESCRRERDKSASVGP